MIQIKQFYAYNDLKNYSYILYDDKSGKSWVIDPFDASPFIEFIKRNGLCLEGILNTHQHFDHIRGNQGLIDTFGSNVKRVRNSEVICLNDLCHIEVLDTPGHTLDHQVFILNEGHRPKALFSGDTLFNSGVGNCKNGGDVNLLFETTKILLEKLSDDVLLYPGHDYLQRNLEFAKAIGPENEHIDYFLEKATKGQEGKREVENLGNEKKVNPFLRLSSEELRVKFVEQNLNERENQLERNLFIKIRELRDQW